MVRGGGGGEGGNSVGGGGNGERAHFVCTGPLRPDRCAGVGMWGELMWGGGQPLRTSLHTISISLQNSFCE